MVIAQSSRVVHASADRVPVGQHDVCKRQSNSAALARYPWPGNIRELQNTLRTSMLHATGPVLLPQFLPSRILETVQHGLGELSRADDDFRRLLMALLDEGQQGVYQVLVGRLDRLALDVLHQRTGGNQVQMSRILGITRNTLRAKLRAADMLPRLMESRQG